MVPREERPDKGEWFHDEVSGELWGRQRIESEWTGKNNGGEDSSEGIDWDNATIHGLHFDLLVDAV